MKNKVCIITGASGGIGSAIAEALFNAGFKLVLIGRNEEKLKKVANGRDCLIIPGDILDDNFIKYAVEKTVEVYGGIDVLINNAGIAHYGLLSMTDEATWDRLFDVNVKGIYHCVNAAMPAFLASERPPFSLSCLAPPSPLP